MFRGVIFSAVIFARPPYGRVRRASVARRWVEGARDVLAARARVRSAVHRARLLAPPCRAPPPAPHGRAPGGPSGPPRDVPRVLPGPQGGLPGPRDRGAPGDVRHRPPRGGGAPPDDPGPRGTRRPPPGAP